MTVQSKGWIKNETKDLVRVDCVNCNHTFKIQFMNLHGYFECVKCGSKWSGDYVKDK